MHPFEALVEQIYQKPMLLDLQASLVSPWHSRLIFLPCEATTCPEQVHKGNTNKTVYIEDQVGFLKTGMRNEFIYISEEYQWAGQPVLNLT